MNRENYDYRSVELKWQKRWFDKRIYEVKKEKDRKKFFLHFAYPGVSGYLHVGHMRGFTYCDIIARYKRMKGYNVLFPAGFHASGIPSIGFAKKVERKDKNTIKMLKENGCSDEQIEKLKNPLEVVNYFSKVYVEQYWKRFGFLIDYTRLMSTISEGYKKFIQWQFLKLKEKNLFTQKEHFAPYCPNCGPVAVDKSETDISKGGNAEILEFTIIKFKLKDGIILPAATLRPETIFGVTNMWIRPDVDYEKVKIGEETWICSKECIKKLSHQIDNVKPLGEKILGKKLVGEYCKIPLINREVPILESSFPDPDIATGIVMSVPAHAPYDWIALVESGKDIKPIQIIEVKGFGTNPAKEVCEQLGIKSQKETDKLDEATELLYKKEFHTGILNELCGEYAGLRISEIKDAVKTHLIERDEATVMREFSEEVICRCGEKVVIKKIPDQWFIKYSDPELTEKSKKHAATMNIIPEEYKEEIPKVLEWFDDRACIRKGSWLGTEFPFKKGWIIEPISDSTLYPIYYIVSKYVNEGVIKPEEMTEEFFDYIFLGKGEARNEVWERIKEDVDYWYPDDLNLGGKEHKTVHFPVFIMNHAAILPEKFWPRGIFVHWWVTQRGAEKISKSKGGAEPIPKATEIYGVDTMRLYYAHIGSPFIDVEWNKEVLKTYKNRLNLLWNLVKELLTVKDEKEKEIDSWLKSRLVMHVRRVMNFMDNYSIREAANEIFFDIPNDLKWYKKRGGKNRKIIDEFLKTWIKLMAPFTPHLAEELWEKTGEKGFVSNQSYPEYEAESVSIESETGEELIKNVVDDIREILKVTKKTPQRIYLYTSPDWKYRIYQKIIEKDTANIGQIMKEIMQDEEMRKRGKEIAKLVADIVKELKPLPPAEKEKYRIKIDENYLNSARDFLQREFKAEFVIENADKASYDPANKARFAKPLKPAIYIE